MSFHHPEFLWALFACLIPLIIHLFNFRRYKKVKFSNVEMLKQLQTESRKSRQIKKWLIMLTRMLAIASMVLAFARPFIPSKSTVSARNLVSIYLDNSESMNAEGEKGPLFENAKNDIRELIQNLPTSSSIQVIDNQLSPFATKTYNVQNVESIIDEIEIVPKANNFNQVIQKAYSKKVGEGFETQQLFVFSDLQKTAPLELSNLDSSSLINLVKSKPNLPQNAAVDSVWLAEPISKLGDAIQLRVKVSNSGSEEIESSTLMLYINDVQQGAESFSIAANSSKVFDLAFTSASKGWIEGRVEITDVPITFDNAYYFTAFLEPNINVLNIGKSSPYLANVFGKDPVFSYSTTNQSSVDYGNLASYDLIILNQVNKISSGLAGECKKYVKEGGVLCMVPSEVKENNDGLSQLGAGSYGKLNKKDISIRNSDLNSGFYKGVYKRIPKNAVLPKVKRCYNLAGYDRGILKLKDGSAILATTNAGRGSIFQFALPFGKSFSSLQENELFVLTMLKMAFSKSIKQELSYNLFREEPITLRNVQDLVKNVTLKKGDQEMIAEHSAANRAFKVWLNADLQEEGIYNALSQDNNELAKIALNHPRVESKQLFHSINDFKEAFVNSKVNLVDGTTAGLKQSASTLQGGRQLWKLFIIGCLIFLLLEVLLLRFFKS